MDMSYQCNSICNLSEHNTQTKRTK